MLPTNRGVKFGHCLQCLWVFGHTNICDIRTIQFRRVSHALVDTQFECGLRLPKALRACEWLECCTRFERWDLTKGG